MGAFLVIAAYALVSSKRLEPDSRLYQLMNLVASILVGASTFVQQAWPALSIQIVWGTIALISLVQSIRKQK